MISCDGVEPQDGGAHLEVAVLGTAFSPFGVIDLGGKALGCRTYRMADLPQGGAISLAHADIDVMVAGLLRAIADDLDPLGVSK